MNKRQNRKKYYEETLPEGYREALVIDAADSKLGTRLTVITLLLNAALFALIWFAYAKKRMDEIAAGFSILKCVGLLAAYLLYVVLHELTHGAVSKLLTGQKLTFGLKPPVAYCGVPDIYAYRVTAILSLLAPFTVFTIGFAAAFFLVSDPFAKVMILALSVLHLSGCAGDLYGFGLFLFRFRNPAVLRQDTGPKQIYYTKE